MPNTNGTSQPGLQYLGSLDSSSDRYVFIGFTNVGVGERLTRHGTMLLYYEISTDQFMTADAQKLYGGGLALSYGDGRIISQGLQVWANWYQAGLDWYCVT